VKPPAKPRSDFPLTPCGNGQWRKIVAKRPYYFGSWRDDPKGDAALKEWLSRKDAILAGLDHVSTPKEDKGMSVHTLIQRYLTLRSADVDNHKLSRYTFDDYVFYLTKFGNYVGAEAKAGKIKLALSGYRTLLETTNGPHAVKRALAHVKAAWNYAMSEDWIEPFVWPRSFVAPSTDSESVALHHQRKGEDNRGERTLIPREVRKLMRATKDLPKWRALLLLMLNTGMNPAELARLKRGEVNHQSGRLRRRRAKTGIWLEAYLWKITRTALARLPQDHEEFYFVRSNGKLLVHAETQSRVKSNRITHPFRKLAESAGIMGITPYTLRRTARTVAANSTDDNAARRMMGQRLTGRDATYVKGPFPLARLKKLSLVILRRVFRRRPKAAKKLCLRIAPNDAA
jgi:integrase